LDIDLQHGDAQAGAGPVGFSGAAAAEGALGGVKGKEVVPNGRNVNQSGEKKVRQFNEHAEVGDLGDHGLESLAGVGAGLHFKVFQELEFFGFLLRLGGGAFRP
jgi:hypothetical protein